MADPSHPSRVSSSPTTGTPTGLALNGELAFVTEGSSGLQVFDFSDPQHPMDMGTSLQLANLSAVSIQNGMAYLPGGTGLLFVDVNQPAKPVVAGQLETLSRARNVSVSGGYAYLWDESLGFKILDVRNPRQPVKLGEYYSSGGRMQIIDNYVYLMNGNNRSGLLILDLSDPAHPLPLSTFEVPNPWGWNAGFGVQIAGDYVYVGSDAAQGAVYILYVGNPALPEKVASIDGFANCLSLFGKFLYIGSFSTNGNASLRTFDVSVPSNPIEMSDTPVTGVTYECMVVEGGRLFVSHPADGLLIFDLSDPSLPRLIGYYPEPEIGPIAVSGDRAFIGAGTFGHESKVLFIDVKDPSKPTLAGRVVLGNDPVDLAVDGSMLYVADYFSGLEIFDLSLGSAELVASLKGDPATGRSLDLTGGVFSKSNWVLQSSDNLREWHPVQTNNASISSFHYLQKVGNSNAFYRILVQ